MYFILFLGLSTPSKKSRLSTPLTPGSSHSHSQTPGSSQAKTPSSGTSQAKSPGSGTAAKWFDSPFNRFLKIDCRSKAQLKFDLDVTKFLVQANLPFNLVSTSAFQQFVHSIDKKFHIKNPTTFSKAKLPLLYKQVKDAVQLKMKKELSGTNGIAFTSDMWSSR